MPDFTVRIGKIRNRSLNEGPGYRTVLWFAGCRQRCPGCINPELWPAMSGQGVALEKIWCVLDYGRTLGDMGVTFVGGEPLDQPQALAEMCEYVRDTWPLTKWAPRLIVYSGYTFEELQAGNDPAVFRALAAADVLVDGPFIQALFDANLGYRGSRNQRVMDLQRTLETGHVVTLDWDRPRITIHTNGVAVMSPVVARQIGIGVSLERHCGQQGPAA